MFSVTLRVNKLRWEKGLFLPLTSQAVLWATQLTAADAGCSGPRPNGEEGPWTQKRPQIGTS